MHRAIGLLPISALISGCASIPQSPTGSSKPPSLVPVSSIVNAIKCELAETFAREPKLRDLIAEDSKGADIGGQLTLSNVVANARSGDASAEFPLLGVPIGPSFSAAQTATGTQTLELKFSYDVHPDLPSADGAGPPQFCNTLQVKVEGDPFVTILTGIQQQYERIETGEPKVALGSLAYTSKFEIKDEVGGGVKIKFLFISAGTKVTHTNTDSQALTLTFNLGLPPKLYGPG